MSHEESQWRTRSSLLMAVKNPQDEKAWRDFDSTYRPLLVDFCRHRGLDENLAEELAQGVLVKLLHVMPRFQYDPSKGFRSWLRVVTRNAIVDYLEKEGRQLGVGTGDSRIREILDEVAQPESEMSELLSKRMQFDLVCTAEAVVRPRFSEQTWKVYTALKDAKRIHGRTANDVATELDMSVAAVYRAKHRVVTAIKNEIPKMLAKT